ncbi:hypothetical protein A2886_00840 [candidate division WWE3 bacterium RIFCSPHIGHO2_01_FULL_42_13]|uniref:Uncharacterized protein n=1 Tax=candidate division WWE3 bacterium RIFCSPHIGHO2_01_FULL_42_13 TaxID=1802617 RepID=A0A1F4UQC8_UNCKA|nr:MAG: hypothetical protein A2886_00840 [candidate division WWE3 bacterium RIFCSPHIGHO2_01_FULL_42_13]
MTALWNTFKNLRGQIKKWALYFEAAFYILLIADILLLKGQNGLVYIILLFYYLFVVYIREFEPRVIYIFSAALLIATALLSGIGATLQADKTADYAFIYILAGLVVETKILLFKRE